jgi:hypothetical protein
MWIQSTHLPRPCMFFLPRFVFVEMQTSYPSVFIVFYCILLGAHVPYIMYLVDT